MKSYSGETRFFEGVLSISSVTLETRKLHGIPSQLSCLAGTHKAQTEVLIFQRFDLESASKGCVQYRILLLKKKKRNLDTGALGFDIIGRRKNLGVRTPEL